jgi:GYF domain 2
MSTDGSSEPPPLPNDPQASSDWYYERQGKRIGPVAVEVIRKQLQGGEISLDTLVWNRALGPEWQPLRTTPILLEDSGPPPFPTIHVSNFFAWTLAFVPIIGAILEKVIVEATHGSPPRGAVIPATWITYSILALIDEKKIENSRRNLSQDRLVVWAILFIPAYLFLRARALRQSFTYFYVWVFAFILGVVINNIPP